MQAPFVQILIVKPDGYIHSEAFAELAETLRSGLKSLGIDAKVVENHADPSAANIVLGWHLLREEQALPKQCILYNLEQMDRRNQAMRDRLVRMAKRCEIWDYSLRNIQILYQNRFPALLRHVPLGSVPTLARIAPAPEQDIDVLFYGSMNPRRAHVIEELKGAGLKVHAVFGVYGPARDALIARAKVVLNLHFYDTNIFEMVRVSYLWMNRKAVVAECNQTTELEDGLESAACFVPYGRLREACQELVANPEKRHALEERAFEIMSARDETAILRRVLAGEAEVPPPHAVAPVKLSLVVNTWNEEKMLPGLLDSCQGVDEIVVADMNSTDRTIEIARAKGASITALPFAGGTCVEPGRQAALASATGDWILVLDADERLPENGLQRLRQIIANSPADVSAYSLAFQVLIGAMRIRATGWEPRHERHVRLFRRGRVQWPALVHAVPKVDGRVVEIAEDDVLDRPSQFLRPGSLHRQDQPLFLCRGPRNAGSGQTGFVDGRSVGRPSRTGSPLLARAGWSAFLCPGVRHSRLQSPQSCESLRNCGMANRVGSVHGLARPSRGGLRQRTLRGNDCSSAVGSGRQ